MSEHNAGSLGVALLGGFATSEPAAAAREALVALLAFEATRARASTPRARPST